MYSFSQCCNNKGYREKVNNNNISFILLVYSVNYLYFTYIINRITLHTPYTIYTFQFHLSPEWEKNEHYCMQHRQRQRNFLLLANPYILVFQPPISVRLYKSFVEILCIMQIVEMHNFQYLERIQQETDG